MNGLGPNRNDANSDSLAATPSALPGSVDAKATAPLEVRAAGEYRTGDASGELGKTLELISAVARARSRSDAVVAMVKIITAQFPGCMVRCGLGNVRLRRFFDARLGWMASSSDLFKLAASRWDDDNASLPRRGDGSGLDEANRVPEQNDSPNYIRLNIDDEVGLGRCVLWIEDIDSSTIDRQWIRRALPTLRTVLWQRTGGIPGEISRSVTSSGSGTRVYVLLAILGLLLLAVWPVSYRVRCTAVVRPEYSRVIASPFEAVIESSHVVPGDPVSSGQPLMTLDGRPLRIELEAIDAQIAQIKKEKDIAIVSGRVADGQQAGLKIRELSRRQELLQGRLDRLVVTSPIDGILVKGDLQRSVGTPLEMGQAVMEVAPLDQMEIELEIPEYEIGYVKPGSDTRIRLASGRGDWIQAKINGIYPSAEVRDDQNVFIARIAVSNQGDALRPGMRGDAIAYGPIRPWLWSIGKNGWERLLWWIGY